MKFSDAMSRDICLAHLAEMLKHSPRTMKELDLRILPVVEHAKLVLVVTGRDLVIFGLAKGYGLDSKICRAMRQEHLFCFEDQDATDVSLGIDNLQVRRVPVIDREENVVGTFCSRTSLLTGDKSTEDAMNGVSRPADGQSHPAGTER